MKGITTYLSILTLNINRLNSPIKRYHLENCIKKEYATVCYLQETPIIDRKKALAEGKRLEEDLPNQWPQKQAGVAILISYKIDFKLTFNK
jgi:exonuclease III